MRPVELEAQEAQEAGPEIREGVPSAEDYFHELLSADGLDGGLSMQVAIIHACTARRTTVE